METQEQTIGESSGERHIKYLIDQRDGLPPIDLIDLLAEIIVEIVTTGAYERERECNRLPAQE